jgi:hypothetical protein
VLANGGGGGGAGTWGSITGTLSLQSDLETALNLKLNTNGSAASLTSFPTLNQNTTGSAATLTTPRAIYGNNFNGSVALTQIIASTYGGTGNGFTKFTGATQTEKTYTLPDVSTTILTSNSPVTVAQGGTGRVTSTIAYGLLAAGTTATGVQQTLATGSGGQILRSGGSGALPSYSTATYPAVAGTARKMVVSDGTNLVMSTETYDTPGTVGNMLMSDGTNQVSTTPVDIATVMSQYYIDATSSIQGQLNALSTRITALEGNTPSYPNYYVANAGSDAADGLTPATAWQTISKINGLTILSGTGINFNKGDTWHEILTVPSSGISGNPIVFGSYGTGNKPIIDGSDIVSTWTADNSDVETGGTFVSGLETETSAFTTEWTTKTVANSNTMTVSSTVKNHGTNSALITFNGTGQEAYAYKDLSNQTEMNFRFYFYLASDFAMHANGSSIDLGLMYDTGNGWLFGVVLEADAGSTTSFHLKGDRIKPTDAIVYTGANGSISRGAWHYVEIEFDRGTTNGGWQMWLDGNSVGSDFTLNTIIYNPNRVYIGDAGELGYPASTAKIYFDDIKVSTSVIGAFPAGVANVYDATIAATTVQVFRDGLRATKGSSKAALNDHEWFCSGTTLSYRDDSGTPQGAGYVIAASVRNSCIEVSKGFAQTDYITIDGLDIRNSNLNGIFFPATSTGAIIKNCDVKYNYNDGIRSSAGEVASNVLVTTCNLSWNGGGGVDIVTPSHNWTISYNNVFRNCQYNDSYQNHNWNAGIHTWCEDATVKSIQIIHNTIYSNGKLPNNTYVSISSGRGIHFDTVEETNYTDGSFVGYNFIYDNNQVGILLEHASYHTVAYNLVYNNIGAYGIAVSDYSTLSEASYNKVYNNVCYGNLTGIVIQGTSSLTANRCRGNIVKNNISFGNSNNQLGCYYGGENDGTMGSGNVYQNNALGVEGTGFIQWGSGVNKNTYAAWASAYGSSTNSIQTDPLLVNSTSLNFQLQTGSPCINAGVNVGLTTDFLGNPIIGLPDIGAYEKQ